MSSIIIVGGVTKLSNSEFDLVHAVTGDPRIKRMMPIFPKFPKMTKNTMTLMHNGTILVIENFNRSKKCFQLYKGAWNHHSFSNKNRIFGSAVSTSSMSFIFGGLASSNTYEYLPKDSNVWILGKSKIPAEFVGYAGFAIATKTEDQILLIRSNRIIYFDVKEHVFKDFPLKLHISRSGHKCAYIPRTNKIIITGGFDTDRHSATNSTEILDLDKGTITMGSPMNFNRACHGIGIVTIEDEDKLAVFGGTTLEGDVHESVEFYNSKTKTWEPSKDIKLTGGSNEFGFINVKYDYISKLLK